MKGTGRRLDLLHAAMAHLGGYDFHRGSQRHRMAQAEANHDAQRLLVRQIAHADGLAHARDQAIQYRVSRLPDHLPFPDCWFPGGVTGLGQRNAQGPEAGSAGARRPGGAGGGNRPLTRGLIKRDLGLERRAVSAYQGALRRESDAAIAQLVEHVIRNDGVTGSSPVCGTIFCSRARRALRRGGASDGHCQTRASARPLSFL